MSEQRHVQLSWSTSISGAWLAEHAARATLESSDIGHADTGFLRAELVREVLRQRVEAPGSAAHPPAPPLRDRER